MLSDIAYKFATWLGNKFGFYVTQLDWYSRWCRATLPNHTRQTNHFINQLTEIVHSANYKWWLKPGTNELLPLTNELIVTKIMLIVTELSEAVEGLRKNLFDDKLTDRKMFDVELADALIRLLDLSGRMQIDLGGAYLEKMMFNSVRKDHTHEARLQANGKAF